MDFTAVLDYINAYWPRIVRFTPQDKGTLIRLPRPYLVPCHEAMFQELYYWDAYFMALGLVDTEHEHLIVDMTDNLAYLYQRFGIIPNGSRLYFLSRSQPPFFTALIWLAYDVKKRRQDADALDYLQRMMALAEQEHETVWLGQSQPHHRQVFKGLSRYFDINHLDGLAGCESGWDHSTRFDGRLLCHLPVDLNSILYRRELDCARAARVLHKPEAEDRWQKRAKERAAVMQDLMWDEREEFFFDYDYVNARRNIENPSLAGFYPLWAQLATEEQAKRIVQNWLLQFERAGGLVTTLRQQEGCQWAYPNGWAPLQWLVVEGLRRYEYIGEAQRIMQKWCENCAFVFAATGGKMWEKYNVVDIGRPPEAGLYGCVSGFGWSNAVFADFAKRLAL